MSEEIRLPFQSTPEEEREKSQDEQFWTHIEELLEQIEENTRAGFARRLMPAAPETPPRKGSEAVPKNTAPTSKGCAQEKTAPYQSIRAEKQPAPSILHPAAPPQAKPAGETGKKHSEKVQSPTAPEKQAGKTQGRGHDGVPSSSMASKQKDANAASSAPTKSQEALAQRRQEAISQKQSKGILGALKDNLASWDGSIADKSGVQEAAGLAAGGPLWSAFKELREAIPTGDDADESSLAGILKKTSPKKRASPLPRNVWIRPHRRHGTRWLHGPGERLTHRRWKPGQAGPVHQGRRKRSQGRGKILRFGLAGSARREKAPR